MNFIMIKVILLLLGFIPMFSFAGIIMTSSNERLEDVTITSETDSAIVYIQDDVEKSIAIEQVSAIVYDDGRYKEFSQNTFAGASNSGEYIISLDSAKTELAKLQKNPALAMKFLSDPKLVNTMLSISSIQKAEYENVLQTEISKGTPKKIAKKIAKQASDSIGTIEMLEYIRKNPINNK